VRVCVCVC